MKMLVCNCDQVCETIKRKKKSKCGIYIYLFNCLSNHAGWEKREKTHAIASKK